MKEKHDNSLYVVCVVAIVAIFSIVFISLTDDTRFSNAFSSDNENLAGNAKYDSIKPNGATTLPSEGGSLFFNQNNNAYSVSFSGQKMTAFSIKVLFPYYPSKALLEVNGQKISLAHQKSVTIDNVVITFIGADSTSKMTSLVLALRPIGVMCPVQRPAPCDGNVVTSFTSNGCSYLSCESFCPIGVCPNGIEYQKYAYDSVDKSCNLINYVVDPCNSMNDHYQYDSIKN